MVTAVHLLEKVAANFGNLAKNIIPAFKAETAPIAAAIRPASAVSPAGALGQAVKNIKPAFRIEPMPLATGIRPAHLPTWVAPRPDPALEAKSVFRQPAAAAAPTPRPANGPTTEYEPAVAPSNPADITNELYAQEKALNGQLRDKANLPTEASGISNALRRVYANLAAKSPALDVIDESKYPQAMAARVQRLMAAKQLLKSKVNDPTSTVEVPSEETSTLLRQ